MNKNIYTFLLFVPLFFLSTLSYSQGILKGIITGEDQPEGLISATIAIGADGTVTDSDGSFEITLPAGEHNVTISYTGYDSYKETFSIADGEEKILNISLNLTSNMLSTATVTSGKYEKPLGEVTVSLEVVKPDFVESTNSSTVDQVLDRVPGVTIVDGQANIRGGSGFSYGAGSRVLLLVDDIPILSGDAGFPSWSDVPVENISQIEVVKGAASALYGSSALNGIINIRTAYAKSKPETNVAVYTDIYTSPKDKNKKWWAEDSITRPYKVGASVVHRRKMGKWDIVLGTTAFKTVVYTKNARDNKIRLNSKFRYRFTENLNAGIYANYNFGKSNTVFLWENGTTGAYVGDPDNQTNTKVNRYNIDPFINFTDKYNNKHRYIGRYFATKNDNDGGRGNFSDNYYNEYQFHRKFDKSGIILTSGAVFTNSVVTGTLYGDFKYKSANAALYTQLEKKFYLSKNEDGTNNENKHVLNLTFGARYEYNNLSNPDTVFYAPVSNPNLIEVLEENTFTEARPVFRVGASYQAAEFTYIRASWGQGYRSPTIAEKFITTAVSGLFILPNPLLESETGWSTEIGLKQGFRLGPIEGFMDLSAFWSEYQNMMEFNLTTDFSPVIGFQSKNVGDTVIKGLEASITGRSKISDKANMTFLLGYTFIDPKFKEFEAYDPNTPIAELTAGQINDLFSTSDNNILKYRNKHSFKSDIEAIFIDKYIVGISLNGASAMDAIDEALGALAGVNEYRERNNTGYAILDLRAGYNITEQIKVSMIAKNLLNKEYASRPALLQPMRSVSFRVDCKF